MKKYFVTLDVIDGDFVEKEFSSLQEAKKEYNLIQFNNNIHNYKELLCILNDTDYMPIRKTIKVQYW